VDDLQRDITIIDVAPRDGLQNEPEILPVVTKVALIRRLVEAGIPWVEIGAFVNPRQVPQQAGTTEVAMALTDGETARFTCLIPNMRGYELAVAAGMRHVRLVLADFAHIAGQAVRDGVAFGVAVGAAFGCPFEGAVAPVRVLALVRRAVDLGATEIILADTTGMGAPTQVARLCREALTLLDQRAALTVHFHNTRNTGYANAFAAWQVGVRRFDASLGGIGGCPFAPRAVGNIATEDLVHMFHGMGVRTGIDLGTLLDAANWLAAHLGRPLPALVGKAGPVYHAC
jgi:(R)-citramalyl-CoA lyase